MSVRPDGRQSVGKRRRLMIEHYRSSTWRVIAVAVLLAAASACASPGESQSPAPQFDTAAAARGRTLAENVCSACHAVAPHQMQSPNPNALAFQAVADTPGMSATALNAWLHTSHPTM